MQPLYQPIHTLKSISDNLWMVDGPIIHFYGMPFTTRMVVIRIVYQERWCYIFMLFIKASSIVGHEYIN